MNLDLLPTVSTYMCPRPRMVKDRAEGGVMKAGRKVIELGLEGSLFYDIHLQPGTLRNPGILNLSLEIHVV